MISTHPPHWPWSWSVWHYFLFQVAAKKQETAKKIPRPAPALALAPAPALAPGLALAPAPALALVRDAEGLKGLGQGYADPSVQSWHLSASLSVTGDDVMKKWLRQRWVALLDTHPHTLISSHLLIPTHIPSYTLYHILLYPPSTTHILLLVP